MSENRNATQMDPEQEQLNDGLNDRNSLRIVYQKYLRTRWRIAMLEGQFSDYNNLDLFNIFRPHICPSRALEELNMLRKILDGQRPDILSLAELWSS